MPIIAGNKTFEIREKRDRKFYVGQYICLKHTKIESDKNMAINTMIIIKIKYITDYAPKPDHKIKYITDYAPKPDHVVFSFDIVGDVMTEVEVVQ